MKRCQPCCNELLSTHPGVPMLLLLAACSDYDVNLNGGDKPGTFDTGTDTVPDTDTDLSQNAEECNGLDDNGDGQVDEGFPDDDGNGRADCQDVTCPALDAGVAGPVAITSVCDGASAALVKDPWAVRTKWTYGAEDFSLSTPVVGNLDDDNGDGVVDGEDTPEVLVLSINELALVVLDGATGGEKWRYDNTYYEGVVSIVDVDADGWPDVLTMPRTGHLTALEGDGSVKWITPVENWSLLHTVADIDEDGMPEVILSGDILSGLDGTQIGQLDPLDEAGMWWLATVGDVDNDGDQEVMAQGALYDSDGTQIWSVGPDGVYGYWPFLIQADADPEAEIGFIGESFAIHEPDGTELVRLPPTGAQPGAPCVGDFDGDGAAEVAFGDTRTLVMYESDGTLVWQADGADGSGGTGCNGYDFDNDGVLEVVYAGAGPLQIYDGRTGAILYSDPTRGSSTGVEEPTIADIDHDGHAEVLVTSTAPPAVRVYEHDGDGWPAAGPTWGVHDFSMTNLNSDGSVPQNPTPSWLNDHGLRTRPASDEAPARPDLRVRLSDVCVADCTYGPVEVAVQVWNEGGADVPAGVEVWLFAEEYTGLRQVASLILSDVPAGTALDGVVFHLTPADVGAVGWAVSVDPTDALPECDDTNNTDTWTDSVCP